MTSPSRTYAYVELFGHICLGACAVREVEKYGHKFCEASPLDANGVPAEAQLVAGSAIFRERTLTEEEAQAIAKRAYPALLPARIVHSGDIPDPADEDEPHTAPDDAPPLDETPLGQIFNP